MTKIQCSCGKVYELKGWWFVIAGWHIKIRNHYIRYYKMPEQEEFTGPISPD